MERETGIYTTTDITGEGEVVVVVEARQEEVSSYGEIISM